MPYCTSKMVDYMQDRGLSSRYESNCPPPKKAKSSDGLKARKSKASLDKFSSRRVPSSKIRNRKRSKTSLTSKFTQCSTNSLGSSSASGLGASAPSFPKMLASRQYSDGSEQKLKTPPISINGGASLADNQNLNLFEKTILYRSSLIKSQVDQINSSEPFIDCKDAKDFDKYNMTISLAYPRAHSCNSIWKTSHSDYPNYLLITKLYRCPNRQPNEESVLYFKVLRHLARKHPSIIQTWDVSYSDNIVLVIQEYAPGGTMKEYIRNHGSMAENSVRHLAKQIYLGMDFLGDVGLTHRSLKPAHVLICDYKEMRVKITGFRSTFIYYYQNGDYIRINMVRCWKSKPVKPDFQAPETYELGSRKDYDPISADVWSFGAILYNFLSRKYPYDFTVCITVKIRSL